MAMNREKHIERHKHLHKELDELLADFLVHNPLKSPSETTIMELMQWSHKQTQNPTAKEVQDD